MSFDRAGRKYPLVVIVGPTAVGKTSLSLKLARHLSGEIVSADSRLLYRGMDIGTAKPSRAQQWEVKHHLIDIVNPDQIFSLADYQEAAYSRIDSISEKGQLPLVVGGTGQYIRAVVEGWGIPRVSPKPQLRAELEAYALEHGASKLHTWLETLDPDAAERIDFRNIRRVVRALEVTLVTGVPISRLQKKSPPPYQILQIGLTRPRTILYSRIDNRIEEMLDMGLVDEVTRLKNSGYSFDLPAMTGLGYRQIGHYLLGKLSLDDAVQQIRRETRRFLRQQATWFRLDDVEIRWFDLEKSSDEAIVNFVSEWLSSIRKAG